VNLSVDNIISFTKNLQSEKGAIDLIIIDYLQLIYDNKYIGQRNYEIGEILRKLKALAKNVGCPILVLSQINREYSKNSALNNNLEEPGLFDLKDSGNIEENADFVLFIYKTQKEISDTEELGLFVAKNRNGKQGLKIKKRFVKKFSLFQ
jgi:replicative DNA helicase